MVFVRRNNDKITGVFSHPYEDEIGTAYEKLPDDDHEVIKFLNKGTYND